jgi:dTDP-4-dehydrorhamnose reductase
MTHIVVIGTNGQVGWELVRALQPLGQVTGLSRSELDITDDASVKGMFGDIGPDVVINAAAYTAVDRAEEEEERARAVNVDAVAALAALAEKNGCLLIHYSTDYVFDGQKDGEYLEDDLTGPLSAYGRSKLLGEKALRDSNADWLCFRTSWVYAPRGRNFLRTIVRLALEQEELRIVSDQHGAPTPARLIAETTAQALKVALRERNEDRFRSQLLHLTTAGATSWHGFAGAIVQRMRRSPMRTKTVAKRITPIATHEFPTAARRPANSRLCCEAISQRFGVRMPFWESALDSCFSELMQSELVCPSSPRFSAASL